MIVLRDKSIIVAYIQIFLKEYFPSAKVYNQDGTVTIINKKDLKVTGTYDYLTYMVLSCYMYANFPNERYPRMPEWKEDPDTGEYIFSIKDYDGETPLDEVIKNNIALCEVKSSYDGRTHRELLNVPDRVISYILKEVVSPVSSSDEIFRLQKLIYAPNKIPVEEVGKFTESLENDIKQTQQQYIDMYTVEGEDEPILPPNYKDFKVTGYCDPWTEVLYG